MLLTTRNGSARVADTALGAYLCGFATVAHDLSLY